MLALTVATAAALAGCDSAPPPNRPPVARLALADVIDLGQVVTIDGSRSEDPDGDIALYRFTIADGTARDATEPAIQHTFRLAGRFEVTLEVVDAHGASDTDRITVTVRAP